MPPAKNEENIFVKGIGIKKVDQIKLRIYFFFQLLAYKPYVCRVFKREIQNWKHFCLKIIIIPRKLLNFENWFNGVVSKSAKSPNLLTLKVNFLCQKLSESFSIFFFIDEYQFRRPFFVKPIFSSVNF